MKLKGSIAVFAVAAAFAGSSSAEEVLIGDCQTAIGWAAVDNSNKIGTGAFAAVQGVTFYDNRTTICSLPKNRKGDLINVGEMSSAKCGILSKLASADNKLVSNKEADALLILRAITAKSAGGGTMGTTEKLVSQNKLFPDGETAIDTVVDAAAMCVQKYIGQGN